MSTVVYDAAVLVAADRNERRTWAEHKARLEFGLVPVVPAPVVVQVSRSPEQAQPRRFLTGCMVVPLGETEAHEAGRLLGLPQTAAAKSLSWRSGVYRRLLTLPREPPHG
jgi:hypothetical protein